MSKTPHPEALGSKLTHPHFTTDFAENQIEFVTKPHSTIDKALTELETLHRAFYTLVPGEKLWPHSMPPPGIKNVSIADFGVSRLGMEKHLYRIGLTKRYPIEMQLISGIHANFSFPGCTTEDYLALIRNFLRHGWILSYLFGAGPTKKYPHATSIRMSPFGYYSRVQAQMAISFNSLDAYLTDIHTACTTPHPAYQKIPADQQLNPNILQIPAEHYTRIRPKSISGDLSQGIDYVEVRSLDLNPDSPIGIEKGALEFLRAFLMFCLEEPSPPLTRKEQQQICEHQAHIALYGRRDADPGPLLSLINVPDFDTSKRKLKRLSTKEKAHFIKLSEKSLMDQRSLEMQELELSTLCLIDAAKKRNIDVEILDRPHSIIRLDKRIIVQQATRTHKDTYIAPLLMDNKAVTKKLLEEHGLSTPESHTFDTIEDALAHRPTTKVVIKPNTANYGDGVAFVPVGKKQLYTRAIREAFKHTPSVLVEEFIAGDEVRLLVIDGVCVAATLRDPANVIGDGKSTMRELIKEKNRTKFPKDRIRMDKSLPLSSIPPRGKKIYLRENSNISTGGDAIDVTDRLHASYKKLACKATKALGAAICGVDMIIPHHKRAGTYHIIELNYNPQLSMHIYPTRGKPRPVCDALLDFLYKNPAS